MYKTNKFIYLIEPLLSINPALFAYPSTTSIVKHGSKFCKIRTTAHLHTGFPLFSKLNIVEMTFGPD